MYSISKDSFGERLSNSSFFINSDISWCLLSSLASRIRSSLNTFVSETLLFFFNTSFALETEVNNLKIKFNNIHGYFIEVTKKNADKLNNIEKFILVQNTINVSRYQTKELRNISLEIENSESESNALEIEMYKKLCERIINETENLNSVSKQTAFLDVICNFANLSENRGYTRPKISKEKKIDIVNGRHPVVEESLKKDGDDFTPNDCSMTSEKIFG